MPRTILLEPTGLISTFHADLERNANNPAFHIQIKRGNQPAM